MGKRAVCARGTFFCYHQKGCAECVGVLYSLVLFFLLLLSYSFVFYPYSGKRPVSFMSGIDSPCRLLYHLSSVPKRFKNLYDARPVKPPTRRASSRPLCSPCELTCSRCPALTPAPALRAVPVAPAATRAFFLLNTRGAVSAVVASFVAMFWILPSDVGVPVRSARAVSDTLRTK